MEKEKFYIQSIIPDTLRNGTRDNINKNPDILGFILGAIDSGFSVSFSRDRMMPIAKKGKVQVYLNWKDWQHSDDLSLIIFKGKNKQKEFLYGRDHFLFDNVSTNRGSFFTVEINGYNHFICTFY